MRTASRSASWARASRRLIVMRKSTAYPWKTASFRAPRADHLLADGFLARALGVAGLGQWRFGQGHGGQVAPADRQGRLPRLFTDAPPHAALVVGRLGPASGPRV